MVGFKGVGEMGNNMFIWASHNRLEGLCKGTSHWVINGCVLSEGADVIMPRGANWFAEDISCVHAKSEMASIVFL